MTSLINAADQENTRKVVREAYAGIVLNQKGCGCGSFSTDPEQYAKSIGYSEEHLKTIPAEANLGLSCGNPTALAGLKNGEVVLDLGSGAGFDCFLAAANVGKTGKVIGVDMTPEMIWKARDNARKNGFDNVEFRLGEIENLPAGDNSVDVVISNCVLNLSVDKPGVFQEIYRVLKPGGRIAISDIALTKELPEKIRENITAYVGCIGGALLIDEYRKIVESSGLKDINITISNSSACIDSDTNDPIVKAILGGFGDNALLGGDLAAGKKLLRDSVVSIYVEGNK